MQDVAKLLYSGNTVRMLVSNNMVKRLLLSASVDTSTAGCSANQSDKAWLQAWLGFQQAILQRPMPLQCPD